MKSFSLLYNPLAQYIILLFFCLFISSTSSQFYYFNYTESISGKYAYSDFLVLSIQTYGDGTTLVHVARNISTSTATTPNFNCSGLKLEPMLRIRVIQLNGSVIEINSQSNLNFDPVNFCIINNTLGNIVNPITIYPLRDQFILVNYIVAINSSDPTTYEEWGQVIDWSGNSLSKLRYGQSYVSLNKTWIPNSKIQLNVLKTYGFLRAAAIRIDKSDNMSITLDATSTQQTTLLATVDGGYAILNANFTKDDSSLLAKNGGLYATFISYNLTFPPSQAQLYQVTLDNITYNGLYCDYAVLGYLCVISTNIINPSTTNSEIYYLKIHFLTAGTVTNVKLIKNIPNVTGLSMQNWKMKTMPFGGYILENTDIANNIHYIYSYNDETDAQISSPLLLNTNFLDVTAIMKNNNTFLFASPYTNNAQWSLLNFQLPKVFNRASNYGNIQISNINPPNNAYVDSSTTILKITFYEPVLLSTGNITIYKASNGSERQRTMATMNDQCSISSDGLTVNIKLLESTFNEFGEKYYIQLDSNFVKDKNLSEPLSGIDKEIVNYRS
ncbi:7988_t:CDS:2, partial [Cetraspora pellucida]